MNVKLNYYQLNPELLKWFPEFSDHREPRADNDPDEQFDHFYLFIRNKFRMGLSDEDELAIRIFKFIDHLSQSFDDEAVKNVVTISLFEGFIHESPEIYRLMLKKLTGRAREVLLEMGTELGLS